MKVSRDFEIAWFSSFWSTQITLIILKLFGEVDWPWGQVFFPVILLGGVAILYLILKRIRDK